MFPDWKHQKPKPPKTFIREVKQLILDYIDDPQKLVLPLRQNLVRELYVDRGRKAPPGHKIENVLFLDGQFEP